MNKVITLRSTQERFKLKDKDKPRVNLRHQAHHTLLWIAYVDNTCSIHKTPKDKNRKYLIRMYWITDEAKY